MKLFITIILVLFLLLIAVLIGFIAGLVAISTMADLQKKDKPMAKEDWKGLD